MPVLQSIEITTDVIIEVLPSSGPPAQLLLAENLMCIYRKITPVPRFPIWLGRTDQVTVGRGELVATLLPFEERQVAQQSAMYQGPLYAVHALSESVFVNVLEGEDM